jgi:hypothetical protein
MIRDPIRQRTIEIRAQILDFADHVCPSQQTEQHIGNNVFSLRRPVFEQLLLNKAHKSRPFADKNIREPFATRCRRR